MEAPSSIRHVLGMLFEEWSGQHVGLQFTGEVHTGNPAHLTADCTHAHQVLGWRPQLDLAGGIQRYVDWYRETVAVGK